jgi:hypothetical protein
MWQPAKSVKALDVDIFEASVIPFKENNRKRMAHYQPIDDLFKWKLDKVLSNVEETSNFNGKSNIGKLVECHIIAGGDHGQGAFQFVAQLLLFSKGTVHKYNLEFEEDFLCGFVKCKKDTHDVLKATIAEPLNESLKRIATGEELVFLESANGDKRWVEWGAAKAASSVHNGAKILHSIPVQLFFVGDLAFQLMAQGREAMSSYWCPRCQWGWADWQCLPCETASVGADNIQLNRIGKAWTWEDLKVFYTDAKAIEEDEKRVKKMKEEKKKKKEKEEE